MHYNINYSAIAEQKTKEAKALTDIIKFIGLKRFKHMSSNFKLVPMRLETFRMYCSITGIHGYPVDIWYKEIYGVQDEK